MKEKDKKQNAAVKRSMYELFGVGGGEAEVSQPTPAAAPAKTPAPAPAPQPAPVPVKKAPPASLLAEGTTFEGTLCAKGDVEIAGGFKGSITTAALSVEEGAVITGNVQIKPLAKEK